MKLKWLAPSRNDDEKHFNTSSVGNGHELLTVKAGQFVSFECNAAAQPQPRIRWFRIGPPASQGVEIGKTAAGRLERLHGEYGSQIPALMVQHNESKGGKLSRSYFSKLDEAQIRSSLLQMDAIPNLGELTNRFEITSSSSQSKGEFVRLFVRSSIGNNNDNNYIITYLLKLKLTNRTLSHPPTSMLVLVLFLPDLFLWIRSI